MDLTGKSRTMHEHCERTSFRLLIPCNIGMTHVEGHVAAIIRERARAAPTEPVHASLVLTREPCPGRLGCQALLRDLLPAGSSITVYVKQKSGPPTWFDTFDGNGRVVR